MNERELKSIANSLEELTSITDALLLRTLENKSWIVAFYGSIVEMMAKQSGKSEKEIKAALRRRQKAAYQKLLEKIEKQDPALAAQLDNRNIGDVL